MLTSNTANRRKTVNTCTYREIYEPFYYIFRAIKTEQQFIQTIMTK